MKRVSNLLEIDGDSNIHTGLARMRRNGGRRTASTIIKRCAI
jgi:hypothetical protein